MLTYRGDKFVRGKKFTINESLYRFAKRDEEKLIFESVSDGSKFIMTEDEFNEAERLLTEKINQENKEINDIIGKALRSKTIARKYEDKLKSYGIDVDYNQSQGVTLKGPNGKYLSASVKEVEGPTAPGHNETHKKPDDYEREASERYSGYSNEEAEKLEKLKAMKRDDIIRKYPDLSTKEALKKHKDQIEYIEKKVAEYSDESKKYADRYKRSVESNRRYKRAGHQLPTRDKQISKDKANQTVDYLNYLTKKYYEKPGANDYWRQGYVAGDSKQDHSGEYGNYNYFGRNGYPGKRSKTLTHYDELKNNIERAKKDVDWSTYKDDDNFNMSYAAMTDDQLEAKIQKMRDDLERKIEELKANNEKNKGRQSDEIKELQAREKELDDFLKSKGIREAVLSIINGRLLKESSLVDSGDHDADYIETRLSEVYDDILTLAQEAQHAGFNECSDKLNDILGILDYIQVK